MHHVKRMLASVYTISEGEKTPKHILDSIIALDTFTSLSGKGIGRYGLRTVKTHNSLNEIVLPTLEKSYETDTKYHYCNSTHLYLRPL